MKTLVSFLAVCAVTAGALAQTPLAETIEVRVTNVDVVVTDKAGKPVTGLTKADFEILENGKPQDITNLYEINEATMANAREGGAAAAAEAIPPEVSQRRILIFVDNYSIHPFARNAAFAALEKSLDALMRPGDQGMLVFWNGRQELMLPSTSNRDELLAGFRQAVKTSSNGASIEQMRQQIIEHATQMISDARTPAQNKISMPEAFDIATKEAQNFAEIQWAAEQGMIESVTRTLRTMGGLEGKKAMIFLGAELSEVPALDLFQQIDSMFSLDLKEIKPAVMREHNRNIGEQLRKLARDANANGVTMYLVDTANRLRGGDTTTHLMAPEAQYAAETSTSMAMSLVANITGGLAVAGGKTFEKALGTIVNDLSSYYSLGYRSPEGEGTRKVVVKVKNPAYHVRSRGTYLAKKGSEALEDKVIANAFHPSVRSDFPVSVVADAPQPAENGRYKVKLTVTMPSTLTLIPQDDSLKGEFAVYFATGTQEGGMSDVTKAVQPMTFPGNSRDAIAAQKVFTYTATLLVQPGEQYVSVAVADTLAGTAGFARTKITAE
jgi:VWFA-related protein